MSGTIQRELLFFFQSFSFGVGALLAYDVLRAARRVFPRGLFLVSLEDFLFFTAAWIGYFLLNQWENDGQVRGFSLAALALGMAVYHFCLGHAVLFTLTFLLGNMKKAVCLVIHTLLRPLVFFCRKPLKKLGKRVKMALQRKRGRKQAEGAEYGKKTKKKAGK